MATTIKNLGVGTITTATTVDLTPGSGSARSWIITSLSLTNKDTVARAIDVKFTNVAGTTFFLAPSGATIPAKTTMVIDAEITLWAPATGNPEKVSLTTSAAPTGGIDYVASGVERDIV